MKTTLVNEDLNGLTYAQIVKHLNIKEDNGDCCGFASVSQFGEIPDNATLMFCTLTEYDTDSALSVFNFVFQTDSGECLILGYRLTAGSGSGWSYGAYEGLCATHYKREKKAEKALIAALRQVEMEKKQ